MNNNETILITGAGGYVGSLLTKELLSLGYRVIAFDIFWYGQDAIEPHENLTIIHGDLRNYPFDNILHVIDYVIHLACISNDPSYELNTDFSKQVNFDGSINLIHSCQKFKIKRFVFASSSSVYGIKNEEKVTEDLSLNPLTPYSYYKVKIEEELLATYKNRFDLVILRPATLCGYSPRLRLDVIGNIFASQAFFEKKLTIHGGEQFRPQLHIKDMVRAYLYFIQSNDLYDGAIFNLNENNYTLNSMADIINEVYSDNINIEIVPIIDQRSYRVNADKIFQNTDFKLRHSFLEGIRDLKNYFATNPSMNWKDPKHHNILLLKSILANERE